MDEWYRFFMIVWCSEEWSELLCTVYYVQIALQRAKKENMASDDQPKGIVTSPNSVLCNCKCLQHSIWTASTSYNSLSYQISGWWLLLTWSCGVSQWYSLKVKVPVGIVKAPISRPVPKRSLFLRRLEQKWNDQMESGHIRFIWQGSIDCLA